MSKSFKEHIDETIVETTPEIEQQRRLFQELVIDQDNFNLQEYCKGKDVGRHILYMYSVGEGDKIQYPPIIEAKKTDSGLLVPKDCELNLGLFETFKLEFEKPSDIIGGFTVLEIGLTVEFEDVPHWHNLNTLETEKLADRIFNYPFVRAIKVDC